MKFYFLGPTLLFFVSCSVDPAPEKPCRDDVQFHFRVDDGFCRHQSGNLIPSFAYCDPIGDVIRDSARIGIANCVDGGFFRIIFRGSDFCAASPADIQIDSILVGIDSSHYWQILMDTLVDVGCTTSTNSAAGKEFTTFHVDFELIVRDPETGDVVRLTEGRVNIPYW